MTLSDREPAPQAPRIPDLIVSGGGTLYLLHANTSRGEEWVAEKIGPNVQTLGAAIAVEHRYIRDIVLGAVQDGLVVR